VSLGSSEELLERDGAAFTKLSPAGVNNRVFVMMWSCMFVKNIQAAVPGAVMTSSQDHCSLAGVVYDICLARIFLSGNCEDQTFFLKEEVTLIKAQYA